MKARMTLVALLGVLAISSGQVSAAMLNLTTGFPDFAVTNNVTTNYDSVSKIFGAMGGLSQYSPSLGVSKVAVNGATGTGMTLTATVDNSGVLTGGTLVLNGVVPQLGVTTVQNLLTANLTAFGYGGTGSASVFEFAGTVTGGYFGASFGSQVGVILNPGTCNFPGTFTGPFSGSTGTVDVFAIPEPCTLAVLGLGGLAVVLRRRRRLV